MLDGRHSTKMEETSQPACAQSAPMDLTSSPPLEPATSSNCPPTDLVLPGPQLPNRKRLRGPSSDASYNNSSDPPLFSSDGPDIGAENYISTAKRRKRMFQGPWWTANAPNSGDAETERPTRAKRSLQRNYDSGVFMGSDGTAAESEIAEEDVCTRVNGNWMGRVPKAGPKEVSMCDILKRSLRIQDNSMNDTTVWTYMNRQQHAAKVVSGCVDEGHTVVDLTNFNLRAILGSTLRPLHCLVRQEHDQPLEPKLRLYLANNDLTSLPPEVYTLQHLATLSIRGNRISELAPQLGQLHLTELNVSMNKLRYLPYTVLRLFRSAHQRSETITEFLTPQFRMRPNPFVVPVSRHAVANASRLLLARDRLSLAARSVPCYLTIEGKPIRGQCPSRPGSLLRPNDIRTVTPVHRTHVPSLFELCLRSAQQHRRTSALLTIPDLPPSVSAGLESAEQVSSAGPLLCDVCTQEYIVPRGEWLEWYAGVRDNEDELLPLLRRVCSWACVDDVFGKEILEAEQDEGKEDETKESEDAVSEEWLLCGWREA